MIRQSMPHTSFGSTTASSTSTRAVDRVRRDALVDISDRRWQTKYVWLGAPDIRRR
ncbi:hypothetical protein [Cellulomonas sp. HD19AZ1]|uniref:hypothetical protein n=1 Tax=Cellulomonas sp. HD19AZ1 TaxID=2559593 RepID=UPI0014300A4A|nr:hypothetical protein [Cellulomonas sp. HD19AZ1]